MGFLAGDDATADAVNRAAGGYEKGKWTTNTPDLVIGTPTLINNWIPYPGATIQGIAVAAGVFTVGIGGEYLISLSVRFSATAAGGHYCFITGSGVTPIWAKSSETGSLNTSCAVSQNIAAGGTFRCYAYSSPGSSATHESPGDMVTGVSVYRLGNG